MPSANRSVLRGLLCQKYNLDPVESICMPCFPRASLCCRKSNGRRKSAISPSSALPLRPVLFYQYGHVSDRCQDCFRDGLAVGYSTIWWAKAVGEGGKVHYTDAAARMPTKRAVTSSRLGLPIASKFVPAKRWNFSPNGKSSSTFYFAMSTSTTIRGSSTWPRLACVKADCSSPTIPCGAVEWHMLPGIPTCRSPTRSQY